MGPYFHKLAETKAKKEKQYGHSVQAYLRSTVSPGQQETTDGLFSYRSDPVTPALVLLCPQLPVIRKQENHVL